MAFICFFILFFDWRNYGRTHDFNFFFIVSFIDFLRLLIWMASAYRSLGFAIISSVIIDHARIIDCLHYINYKIH